MKEILSQINNNIKYRIFICLIVNILLFILLFFMPIETNHSLCLYKNITGKECFNCGMTRAFLSIIHLNFKQAYAYNWRVVIVFPYTVIVYAITWLKYILKRRGKLWKKNTREL